MGDRRDDQIGGRQKGEDQNGKDCEIVETIETHALTQSAT